MVDKNKCTGCTACYAVCAKNAIRMQRDEDGFLQPQVDASRCVNCNLCEMVCPVHKDYTSEVKRVVACRSRKEEIVACSSSGGVFSVLAERVLLHGGAVFGCALTDAKYARHVCIESEGELDQLRRSKYVQSDKNDTFEMVQNMLRTGRNVMFVGTPCEVAGLDRYLGRRYANLLLVDFICHGVPSPMAWEKYIADQEKREKSRVTSVNFRSKKKGWRLFSMELMYEDGTQSSTVLTEDDYMRGFLGDLYLRKSCYACPFKGSNYHSDLTIADFFAVNRAMPEIDHDEGTSLVIAHTEQGVTVLNAESENMNCWELDNSYLSYNNTYFTSPKGNYWRDKALQEMQKEDFHSVIEKYCGQTLPAKIRRKISKMLIRHASQ